MDIFAYAASGSSGSVTSYFASESARGFLESVLGGILTFALPVLGLVLVYIGFMFVVARGNSIKTEQAVRYFAVAVLAIVLILGSYAFAKIAYNTVTGDLLGW